MIRIIMKKIPAKRPRGEASHKQIGEASHKQIGEASHSRGEASHNQIFDPTGRPLTREDLPPSNTKRWVILRKAKVVAGVRNGLISLEEACQRYSLSIDEFLSWQSLFDAHGMNGLRATRLKKYRQ